MSERKPQEKIIYSEVQEKFPVPKRKRVRKIFKGLLYFIIFIIIVLSVFSNKVLMTGQSSVSWLDKIPIIKQFRKLVDSADKNLKGEDRDRINILLLGMGGKNHEGAYLTDTIMLASIELSTKKVALISIPRDMAVPIENAGWRKINNVNAFAEVAQSGSGGLAASQAVSDILQVPIDYYVRVDFDGFINIVNELNGFDIYVENALDDYRYPILGMEDAEPFESRYEHLNIEKGLQHLDGELALKYVRSRHAGGVEGSDFARAKRQQKVLVAAKEKVFSMQTLLNPKKVTNIYNQVQTHLSTNLQIWEMLKLWDILKNINRENILTKVIDNSPNGLLVDTLSQDGGYLLIPRSGDFSEIQYYVNNIFTDAPREEKTRVVEERAAVEVRNGTWINGLASRIATDVEKYGFIVVRIGNSSHQNFEKSVIYDLTYGEKMKSLTILKEKTGANISFGLPEWLMEDIEKDLINEKSPVQPDFILILGQDADKSGSGIKNVENED